MIFRQFKYVLELKYIDIQLFGEVDCFVSYKFVYKYLS